mmetsp:Transcript_9179/g.19997  ORF Transcript_9179/g.19997 Transcript_9179/m.19997 type:complete len:313 (-) Transcript_9179:110-1048(-)
MPDESEPLWKTARMSVFTPGIRRRMNVIPIVFFIFVPWLTFSFFSWLFAFSVFHYHPGVTTLFLCFGVLFWLGMLAYHYTSYKGDLNPSWLKMAILMLALAMFGGALFGWVIYTTESSIYFSNQDLLSYPNVNPFLQKGADLIDAGRVNFAEGSHLDMDKSWHFKHHTLWCVTPIVNSNPNAPSTGSYDFWAVGTDCCSVSSSDFRCGAFQDAGARSGLRALREGDQQNYLLAVQQAETMYDIVASNPVFFYWTRDPLFDVTTHLTRARELFTLGLVSSLFFFLCMVLVATGCFALIARRPVESLTKTPPII